METQSINAISFYKEVVTTGNIWTVLVDKSVPTFKDKDGQSIFYVWSSRYRVTRIMEREEMFESCTPLEIPWMLFEKKWIPDLAKNETAFSLNWSGNNNPIWEESAGEIATNMESHIQKHRKKNS
jgi:hypothetical protein